MIRFAKTLAGILAALVLILCVPAACCSGALEVERIGNIHPYEDNILKITAGEGGTVTIKVHDNICVYRTMTERIEAGETLIHWDGCGNNEEKLYEKSYTVTVELATDSGLFHDVSFQTPIEYPAQYLQYALPSGDTLYLDDPDGWFLEYRTVTKGTVRMDLCPEGGEEPAYSFSIAAQGGKISRKEFSGIAGKKRPKPGDYTVSVYETTRKDVTYTFPLRVKENTPEKEPVRETGEIMPYRSMSDREIWELMMQPSVVVDIDFFKHQDVYSEKNVNSASLGTLHGQTQGLKVIRIEDEWAMVGAWNHEEAAYVEGWVPLAKLKIEYPKTDYGILIDKQRQTLSVYRDGRVIDTLLVSTGRPEVKKLYQETAAGSFLTGYHRVNFSTNGKKYDYVIQFDGGNLLHQAPYEWGQYKKDFTLGRGYLGAKASHACVRIQPEPGEGGLNAYWLFTHLSYHTRVIVTDDPEEREAMTRKLKRDDHASYDLSGIRQNENERNEKDGTVTITFAGSLIAGGTRQFNARAESLKAFLEKEGCGAPFSGIGKILGEDDLTCASLSAFLQGSGETVPEDKETKIASAGMEMILKDASIEMLQMAGDRFYGSGEDLTRQTSETASAYTMTVERGKPVTAELKGHLFGFAGCSEKEYLTDPEIIDRLAAQLKEAGCERIIFLLCFSENGDAVHPVIHEAMARRCVRAGADMVAGDQQGTVRGIDFIEGTPVLYSPGTLLDGSRKSRPKNGYGFLASAAFDFEGTERTPEITVIPIAPYGTTDPGRNDYMPSAEPDENEREAVIRSIWQDSTDAAMQRIVIRIPGQS